MVGVVCSVHSALAAQDPCDLAGSEDLQQPVLTLAEAAEFLRLEQAALAAAAEQGNVPGRRVLGQWRFSRAALIAWLAGADRPAECFDRRFDAKSSLKPGTLADLPPPPDLTPTELAATRGGRFAGRGGSTTAQAEPSKPSADGAEPGTPRERAAPESYGEEPDLSTAREVALRREVLLPAGELTLEVDFAYAREDAQILNADQKFETWSGNFATRYGLLDDLQLAGNVPYFHERSELEVGGRSIADDSDSSFGDVGLSVRYGLMRERGFWPSVILSADGAIPTDGSEAFAAGGGLSLVKSLDPTALFASANYLHVFNAGSRDLADLQAENTVSATLGFAFAMNDRLSFSTSLIGRFNAKSEFDNITIAEDQNYNLRFALTSLLAENLYIEPSVSFRLNGPEDAFTLGLSLPYTFAPRAP